MKTPKHFRTPAHFRRWLEAHHASEKELVVGFYHRASARGGLTYPEALHEALCFGWIDGLRRRVDADSYSIRFTPRRATSVWSLINVRHVQRLRRAGRMHAAGLKAFAARDPKKTGVYSFEQRPQKWPRDFAARFRTNPAAWTHWKRQPPGYHRLAMWFVLSAKQEATRQRRLARVIELSAAGKRLRPMGGGA